MLPPQPANASSVPPQCLSSCTVALVTAASTSHEVDRHDQPKSLTEIGGQPVIEHVLAQLCDAGVLNVLVQVGHDGARIMQTIKESSSERFPDLNIEFHDLGPGWRAGHAMSIMHAEDTLKKMISARCGEQTSGSFLLCPSDAIYTTEIVSAMAAATLGPGDLARMLIEQDLQGMVGLSQRTVHVALRPLHSADRIYQVGTDLSVYSAIDAGLSLVSLDIFAKMRDFQARIPYFTMSEVFQSAAGIGALTLLATKGRTWFSVETEGALDFTRKGLVKLGHRTTLPDGRTVQLVGLPRKVATSPSTGGDWAEFNVAKWR